MSAEISALPNFGHAVLVGLLPIVANNFQLIWRRIRSNVPTMDNLQHAIAELRRDPNVQQFLRLINARGGRNGSRIKKSLAARRTAASRWRLRRARYGERGWKGRPGTDAKNLSDGNPQNAGTEPAKTNNNNAS